MEVVGESIMGVIEKIVERIDGEVITEKIMKAVVEVGEVIESEIRVALSLIMEK